jgi:hypothetical protein
VREAGDGVRQTISGGGNHGDEGVVIPEKTIAAAHDDKPHCCNAPDGQLPIRARLCDEQESDDFVHG